MSALVTGKGMAAPVSRVDHSGAARLSKGLSVLLFDKG